MDEHHFGADAFKGQDAAAAFLAAIEANVVGAKAGRESGSVEEFGVEAGDFEV